MLAKLGELLTNFGDRQIVREELASSSLTAHPYFIVDAVVGRLYAQGQSTEVVERRAAVAMQMLKSSIEQE